MADDTDVLEELARLPSFHHPTASPDGTEVATYYDETGRNELHLLDAATGERRRVSDGEVPRDARWHVQWAPDGERVYFHRDDAGDEQNDVFAIDRDGAVEPVVELDGQVVLHDVGPDGTLYLASTAGGQMNLYRAAPGEAPEQLTAYDRAVWSSVVSPDGERIAYDTNEADDHDNRDVYVADADGGSPRNLELGATGAEATPVDWGPDGRRLLVGDNTEDLGRVGVVDVEARLAALEGAAGDAAGETVDASGGDGAASAGEDGVRWLGDGEYEESAAAFCHDGERVLATRTRRAATLPIVYDLATGEARELDVPEGVVQPPSGDDALLADGRVLLTRTTPSRRPDLLAYDLASDEATTLLAAEYGPFSPEDFADAEYFRFESDGILGSEATEGSSEERSESDGVFGSEATEGSSEERSESDGVFGSEATEGSSDERSESDGVPTADAAAVDHDPAETLEIGALLYDSGERPSPLVVNPHGGPRAADERGFDLYTQFLVQRGYSVLQVNYRGSTGRGRSFVRALYDDWGGAEQGDVATALERVLATRDWVDEDRIAVFGGSYGGYSAYWQLLQYPELYDAGVAWIAPADLETMYEESMPHYRTELMETYVGTPEENPELYAERSPITHAANLDAPLLIVHGVNDQRVPVGQARQMRDRLEELGYERGEDGDFEYVELGEEGHASSDQDQQLRTFRLVDDFLARRLDGE